MPRTKHAVATRKRKRRLRKDAEGYVGGRRKLHRTMKETVRRSGVYAYRDRRNKKRDFRRLWITRISAALNEHELNYSRFIHGLKLAEYPVNRKALSELAIHDPEAFGEIVELANNAQESE